MTNLVYMEGVVDRPPEVRSTPSGAQVTTYVIKNEVYNYKNPEKPLLGWFRVEDWKNHLVNDGDQVLIEGRLKTQSYEAKDGSKRYITKIVANKVFVTASKENLNNDTVGDTPNKATMEAMETSQTNEGWAAPPPRKPHSFQYEKSQNGFRGRGAQDRRTSENPEKMQQKEIKKIESEFRKNTESLFADEDIPF